MSKWILCLTLVLMIMLLCSCSLEAKSENGEKIDSLGESRIEMLNKVDDGEIAAARLEQIIEAIKGQEKDTIKNMFSIQAQNEAKDLDEGIDYLFALIEGNIKSWDRIGGSVDESTNDGHTIKKSRYRFNVYTDKGQYLFSILEYTKDDQNSKNIGVYCLKIINVDGEEPIFSNAGIYMPEK